MTRQTASPADAPGSGSSRADRLIQELGTVGLSLVDAHRAAFCALALAAGWPKARIGRYLGISRARVGQKADKLHDYAGDAYPGDLSTLRHVMTVASSARPWEGRDTLVEFEASAWDDLEWARKMCEIPG